jgi:hypothetical protein
MTTPDLASAKPVHDIANVVGVGVGLATTVLTAALGSGLIPTKLVPKGGALVGLLKLLPAVVSGVMVFVAAKTVAVQATPLVTPVSTITTILKTPANAIDSLKSLIGNIL